MTRLTMHGQGGMRSQSAEFSPPQTAPAPRQRTPLWLWVGGGALVLMMFTGLVVMTTLFIVQSRETARLYEQMALNEPAAPVDATPAPTPAAALAADEPEVTRTDVDLLASDLVPAPAPVPLPAVPLNTRIQPPSCIDYLDTLVKITHVRFPLGSNEPAAADMPRVRNIATALSMCPDVKVVVEGHSDRRGSDKLNMDLSWYRAQTVIDMLRTEGFATAQLVPLGFGARQPINLSGTVSGEGENRRVQFQLVPRDMVVDGQLARR